MNKQENKEQNNEQQEASLEPEGEATTPQASESGQEDSPLSKIIEVDEKEYNHLKEELQQFKDKYIRLYAEFENARKRMEREKFEFVKYANEALVIEFLNILDDIERSVEAAKANHEDYTAFLKGIEMIMAHIYEMLKKNGVKPIEAKDKSFDPNFHEALMQEEVDDKKEGVVLEEFQKGYSLNDKVIRTSKVKISKSKA